MFVSLNSGLESNEEEDDENVQCTEHARLKTRTKRFQPTFAPGVLLNTSCSNHPSLLHESTDQVWKFGGFSDEKGVNSSRLCPVRVPTTRGHTPEYTVEAPSCEKRFLVQAEIEERD